MMVGVVASGEQVVNLPEGGKENKQGGRNEMEGFKGLL